LHMSLPPIKSPLKNMIKIKGIERKQSQLSKL
jgi:hypothetical protein